MSGVFRGCRTLMAAAKASTAKATTTKATTAKATTAKAATTKASAPKAYTKTGILKPHPVSPELEKFLGTPEASRTEVTKKIWDYIKLNNLQNPANKKEINCDEKLKTIFAGKDKVHFIEIAKLLSPHFIKSA